MNMTAGLLTGVRQMEVCQIPKPEPGPWEMLIAVKACSICGSDIRTFNHGNNRVTYPTVIGHEMSGDVVAVGPQVKGYEVGDRICVGADIPAMDDDWSKNGMANLSDVNYAIGYQFPGGFSEYCLLNEMTVRFGPIGKMPAHLDYDQACMVEPLACCINGLERVFMSPGKTVLIMGAGPIGMLLYRASVAFGAGAVVMVDIDEHRVEMAKSLGVSSVYCATGDALKALTADITQNEGFNIIFTACPSPDAHEAAIELISKRGFVNLFGGLPKNSRDISLQSNTLHYKEAYVTGSHGSSPRQFKLALDMISNGRIEVASLVTHRFALTDIHQAFETMESREGLKVVVDPWLIKE